VKTLLKVRSLPAAPVPAARQLSKLLRHLDRVRSTTARLAGPRPGLRAQSRTAGLPIFFRRLPPKNAPTTLVAALDVTVTGMGARLLRSWILSTPDRRNAIEDVSTRSLILCSKTVVRGEIRKELRWHSGSRALTSRIHSRPGRPRELVALRKSLAAASRAAKFCHTPAPAGDSAYASPSARRN